MSKPKQKPSVAQVKAWLTTVIAPLVEGLERELLRSRDRNWTFRFYSRDFEFLWTTDSMVAAPYHANLRQFWRYFPSIRDLAVSHDEVFEQLREACREAYDALISDGAFKQFVAETTPNDDTALKYFAEYVVNNLDDLGSRNVMRETWASRRPQFLGFRRSETLAGRFEMIDRVGQSFTRCVDGLFEALDLQQQSMADEYGLPPVSPSDLAAS